AYVNIILSQKKNVLRVPAAALRFIPPPQEVSGIKSLFGMGTGNQMARYYSLDSNPTDKKTIYLLRSGALVAVTVQTAATDDTYVEISGDGIAAGDTVVTGIAPVREH